MDHRAEPKIDEQATHRALDVDANGAVVLSVLKVSPVHE